MGVRPIETVYNGYRFRSRLEAKWAVYFNKLQIPYVYENEGFIIGDKVCYLPDFYLRSMNAFVEIKPESITSDELRDAKYKLESLCENEHKFGLLCVGDPYDNDISIYGNIATRKVNVHHEYVWLPAEFIIGAEVRIDEIYIRKMFDVGIVVGRRCEDIEFISPCGTDLGINTVIPFMDVFGFDRFPYEEQKEARQARFEHGECG